MSAQKRQPIDNAEAIIELFGGIRPMATKTGIAVTTVQGWKKRGVIPATRKQALIESARKHQVDLSGFIADAPAVDQSGDLQKDVQEDAKQVSSHTDSADGEIQSEEISYEGISQDGVEVKSSDTRTESNSARDEAIDVPASLEIANDTGDTEADEKKTHSYTSLSVESERRVITKSVAIAMTLLALFVGVLAAVFWPQYKNLEERAARVNSLEAEIYEMSNNLQNVKEEQSNFKGLVSENWSEELAGLKRQLKDVGQFANQKVQVATQKVQAASNFVKSETPLDERVTRLQSYVSEVAAESNIFAALMPRFEGLSQSLNGQEILNDSSSALLGVFQNSEGQDDSYLNGVIDSARSKNAALQQTLGNVPQSELKAAAMLLAMTQMRSALKRPEQSFDSDLQLLMKMVDDDNVELRSSLEKIAPHARSGVLSAGGLTSELQVVAGDVVSASLRGEDVSLSDKVSARFNDILQLEKDGELVTGTQTQADVHKAQQLFEGGQWQEAIDFLNAQLDSNELKPLKPWIERVQGAISARDLQRTLEQAIELNFGDGLLGGAQLLEQ